MQSTADPLTMFAVTGWSVSSSALKTQTLESSQTIAQVPTSDAASRSSGKRKRGHPIPTLPKVNSANFVDLWENVMEKKYQNTTTEPQKKYRRGKRTLGEPPDEALRKSFNSAPNENKFIRGGKQQMVRREIRRHQEISATGPIARKPIEIVQGSKENADLTPLQINMRQKLISARFRHINERLYTTPSANSFELFQQNPEMFQDYHEGFRQQVQIWPENPVNGYIAQIRLRGMHRGQAHGQINAFMEKEEKEQTLKALPLPRSDGVCHIADLGCGDAVLSLALEKSKKKFGLQVFSYDLQGSNPLVTKADIADLPLKDGSIDVAIFCLALMGTNWIDFIEEAFRVLRWKGELWVAEIKSRFGRVSATGKSVEHSVGNRTKSHKSEINIFEEDADNANLLGEVGGYNDEKAETDVSAFVEVLLRRGFILRNGKAVDLSNKMFVTMTFIRGQSPAEGKCVPAPRGTAEIAQQTWKRKSKARFIDDDAPFSGESNVLKPCVYKLR